MAGAEGAVQDVKRNAAILNRVGVDKCHTVHRSCEAKYIYGLAFPCRMVNPPLGTNGLTVLLPEPWLGPRGKFRTPIC
jgi:hypothetical protein